MNETRSASPLRGMDLTTIRLLLAARQEGNLARVAARERIAISAISRRITDFEQRFGVAMFSRHDRGVTPTRDGNALLDKIAQAMALLEHVAQDMDEMRGGTRGFIRMRVHVTAIHHDSLSSKLVEFLDRYPDVEIEVDEDTSLATAYAVKVGTCDIGIIAGTIDHQGLELIPWIEDHLVVALPADHPLCAKNKVTLLELTGESFIGMQRESALLSLYRAQVAAQNGPPLRERAHATSFETVRKFVAAGFGVSIIPEVASGYGRHDGLVIRPLDEAWAGRQLMLCVRDRRALSGAAQLLIDHLATADPSQPWADARSSRRTPVR